jgi:hypothetical protein
MITGGRDKEHTREERIGESATDMSIPEMRSDSLPLVDIQKAMEQRIERLAERKENICCGLTGNVMFPAYHDLDFKMSVSDDHIAANNKGGALYHLKFSIDHVFGV